MTLLHFIKRERLLKKLRLRSPMREAAPAVIEAALYAFVLGACLAGVLARVS